MLGITMDRIKESSLEIDVRKTMFFLGPRVPRLREDGDDDRGR